MTTSSTVGNVKDFPAGTALIQENERSRKMFIIKEGRARVYKTYHGNRFTLAILGPGEVFGELSFFDAEPRSASVEALTDMKVIVIGGEEGLKQIESLPKWIFPVFKSISVRLREADQRLTVLQSIHEFQKKTFGTDKVANTIYIDLLSFVKALKLAYFRDIQTKKVCKSEELLKELDDVLGSRHLGLKVFWKLLAEQDFIDNKLEKTNGAVDIRGPKLDAFQAYLEKELTSGRYLLLSHNAMGVLRKIAGFTKSEPKAGSPNTAHASMQDLDLASVPYHDKGLKELEERDLVKIKEYGISFKPDDLYHLLTYQTMVKAFDHTKMGLE